MLVSPSIKLNSSNNKVSFGKKIEDAKLGSEALSAKTLPFRTYVVEDGFEVKEIDVDGDGKNDLSHGEFICRLIKSLNPNATVIPFKFGHNLTDEQFYRRYDGLVKFLKKMKPDGINRSIGMPISYVNVNFFSSIDLNKGNFKDNLEVVKVKTKKNNDPASNFIKFITSKLEEITKSGLKLYNSGGNKGDDYFNAECLAEGVQVVGSTDAQKNLLQCSADTGTMKFAQGIYDISEVKDDQGNVLGYDITGNGKVDIKAEEVSSKGKYVNPLIKELVGKPLKDYLMPDREFEILKYYHSSRWPDAEELQKRFNINDQFEFFNEVERIKEEKYLLSIDQIQTLHITSFKELDEYRECGKYKTLKSGVVFDVDKDGNIIYDPDRSGRKDVIKYVRGASFASPTYMVTKDIEEANKK